MFEGRKSLIVVTVLLVAALMGGFGLAATAISMANGGSGVNGATPSTLAAASDSNPTGSASAPAGTPPGSPSPTSTPTALPTPTSEPTPSPTPVATPTPGLKLPSLLAAIGDSYSQAYSVSPQYLRDHPQFSWVVGTAPNDGVTSILERLRALGARPAVVDAATSGKKMDDAQRQAEQVVAAAANLEPGQTAYVTFELGTNDLCDDPTTAAADYQATLQTALGTLQSGLPAGSRLLMLAVPDFSHLHAITQANPVTKAAFLQYRNSRRCAPFLGYDSPLSLAQAAQVMAAYNAALEAECNALNAAPGATLTCTWNQTLLSDRDFTVADLSTVDYFHPSLSGQAKMAADAWKADVWSQFGR